MPSTEICSSTISKIALPGCGAYCATKAAQNMVGRAMNLDGKVAVITGAASGIGRAVATALAHRGVRAMALSWMSTMLHPSSTIPVKGGQQPFHQDKCLFCFRLSYPGDVLNR